MRRATLLILATLSLAGCAEADEDLGEDTASLLTGAERVRFARGRHLFFRETFEGNGRACGTCHRSQVPSDNFDVTPADVQARFEHHPHDPLFRSIDSDDGAGSSYTRLLRDATFRIPFTLPSNVTVDEMDSPDVQQNADGTITVFVRRSSPTVENIALDDQIMWDGREGADLAHQAGGAVDTHDQPGRAPTAREKDDIAFFERQLFSNDAVRDFAAGGPAPELPPGVTDSERRGRTFFIESGPVIDANHRGLCATCHSGPMLDTTGQGNPVQPPGERISNNFVSETNMLLGNQNPELTYRITLQEPLLAPPLPFPGPPPGSVLIPAGAVITLRSSDPGRILTTGDPCESPLACIINAPSQSTTSFFKIPTLWGVADSAPYFHDNSAADLDDVMDVYQFLFQVTADGLQNPAFVITAEDRADIIAYVRYAFRHEAR